LIGFIDIKTQTSLDDAVEADPDFGCPEHPESFQLAPDGRIFVNIADKKCVQVISNNGKTEAMWDLPAGFSHNFPICLGHAGGRLDMCWHKKDVLRGGI
jgi:hypothetical protein